ncbi:MAG: hypothetical protein R3Y29_05665 [bacterium]
MKNELNNSNGITQLNVYDNYKNTIVPKVKLLDILLKADCNEFDDVTTLNQLLSIFELEKSYLEEVLYFLGKSSIDKELIFYLILNTNSNISNIIKRELSCGSPNLYSPHDISYIYQLDFNKVTQAFKFLNYKLITSYEIELILFQLN